MSVSLLLIVAIAVGASTLVIVLATTPAKSAHPADSVGVRG